MDHITEGLKICRGKPSLVEASQAMTVLVIYEVNHGSCYYRKLLYRPSKSKAHITVANGVCEPL